MRVVSSSRRGAMGLLVVGVIVGGISAQPPVVLPESLRPVVPIPGLVRPASVPRSDPPTRLPDPPGPLAPAMPLSPADQLPAGPVAPPTPAEKSVPTPTAPGAPDKVEPKKDEAPKQWVVGDNLGMTARWNHGLHLETADKAFRIHPVGRMQFDSAFMLAGDRVQFAPGGVGRVDDAVAFRRLRFGLEGTIWEVFGFWIEPDYFNTFNSQGPNEAGIIANTPAATDLWGQLTNIPWIGNFRFGSVKPVYSFEHMTSSRFLSFMERSIMFDAFVGGIDNGFQPGFVIFNWSENQRATWHFSLTHNTTNIFGFNVGDGEPNYAARVTGLPVYREDGRQLVHLGLSYNHRSLDDRQDRFRARTMVRNGPAAQTTTLVDLRLAGTNRDMLIPEFAAVFGPWSMQAEYLGTWVHGTVFPATGAGRRDRGTLFFQGFYVDMMYFLTGESRPYNTPARACSPESCRSKTSSWSATRTGASAGGWARGRSARATRISTSMTRTWAEASSTT